MPPEPKPTPGEDIKSESMTCGRCKRTFAHLAHDEIRTIEQLRVGTLLITHIEGNCIYCGQPFRWKIREKEIKDVAVMYGEILRGMGYVSE